MHADFADWHRVVSIEPQADELQKRWEAIEAFSKASKPIDLPELTRLFYGLAHRDDGFLGRFRSAFKAKDETFRMKDNDAELRVLAGACLVDHFKYENNGWGAAAALALTSASCLGFRSAPVVEIVQLAEKTLSVQSAALRSNKFPGTPPQLDLSQDLQELKTAIAANTVPGLSDPLIGIAQKLAQAVCALNTWSVNVSRQQALRAEESDVLWWLHGGHSRDPISAFSDLKPPSACLVSAKDLADLTRQLPGPFAADAFLGSVLKAAQPALNGKVSIADGVGACSPEYLVRFLAGIEIAALGDLCPMHYAVRVYLDAERKKSWLSVFANTAGFKATEKTGALDLAVQVYRERLFFRAMRNLEAHDDGTA